MKNCKRCNNEFEPVKGLINYCSLECRNSRGPRSEEFKKAVSKKLAGRTLSREHIKKLSGENNPRWNGGPNKVKINVCVSCNNKFEYTGVYNKKTCSRKCQIHASTNRTYRNGSRKTFKYNGVILESSWQLEIAGLLDTFSIEWIRPNPIEWVDTDNKNHLYYPDFYLPQYNIYLDPKNPYCMDIDKEKMIQISNKVNIIFGDLELIKYNIYELT